MTAKRYRIRLAEILQVSFCIVFASSIFNLWAYCPVLPSRFQVRYLTGMAVVRDVLPVAILPLIGVIIAPLLTALRNPKEPTLRWFLHVLNAFVTPLFAVIMLLALLDLGGARQYYLGFYLFLSSLAGIFLIALYSSIADYRAFKNCVTRAREEKPNRVHLKVAGAGMYAIVVLLAVSYLAFNGIISAATYLQWMYQRTSLTAHDYRMIRQFMSVVAPASVTLLFLVVLNFPIAFFVRRGRRWAAAAAVIALALYSYYVRYLLYLIMKYEYRCSGLYLWTGGLLYNPFFYFLIYCFVTLVFIEKLFAKRDVSFTPPR